MKLWLISQTVNSNYDTYDSAVVAAETEDDARMIVPGGYSWESESKLPPAWRVWASGPDLVTAKYIGEAAPGIERGVVLASFNAG